MASTTAMMTGLTGLNASARSLDVIGNNIANVNTTAFKGSRVLFSTQMSRNLSLGTAPGDTTGGTNPAQVGLGVAVGGIQRNFAPGALSTTGDQRDLAIEGRGFFIVDRDGAQMYTRAGAFRQNSRNDLITPTGERVLGYGVDDQFNITPGALEPLNLPTGQLTIAEATRNVQFTGNLNADGDVASRGSTIELGVLSLLGGGPAQAGSLLTDVEDTRAAGTPLVAAGQVIELRGAEKGTKEVPAASLTVTAASTVQDLLDFLVTALGIDGANGANPDGSVPGASIDGTGAVRIVGNVGTVNDLVVDGTDLRVVSSGTVVKQPFAPVKTASADGESVRTTYTVYDSLGTTLTVDTAAVLVGRSDTGLTWRVYVTSPDDAAQSVQTGLIEFDTFGQLTTQLPLTVGIDRSGSGAVTPLTMDLLFRSASGNVTSLADTESSLAAVYQDGSPLGELSSYAVGQDGVITGAFTNGLTRTIGQVALAVFANDEGLVEVGNNLYQAGTNSGTPVVTTPGALGAGPITGGALELSNVDLAQEFIGLIQASTAYSASSRVITTTDQLMQQLLVLGR